MKGKVDTLDNIKLIGKHGSLTRETGHSYNCPNMPMLGGWNVNWDNGF